MKTILFSVSFLFHRIDSSFMEPTSLYASIAVNKAAKRVQIKFRLQPSFYDKALQSYKKNRTNTSIIFSFFSFFWGALKGNSARQILTADG